MLLVAGDGVAFSALPGGPRGQTFVHEQPQTRKKALRRAIRWSAREGAEEAGSERRKLADAGTWRAAGSSGAERARRRLHSGWHACRARETTLHRRCLLLGGLPTPAGSIRQHGAEAQAAHEIEPEQGLGASLSAASGRNKSQPVDAGRAGSDGGSFRALSEGVGGRRHRATPVLSPPTGESIRRQRRRLGILKEDNSSISACAAASCH